ncbi:hypothetical protein [Methylomagnum sp.]
MRRALLVLTLALSVASAGCAGAEGRQAQELLDEAEQAFAGLDTYTLGGTMRMTTPLGEVAVRMRATVDQDAGAMLMTMKADDLPGFSGMSMVARPDGFWMKAGGGWQLVPMPAGAAAGAEQFDILPFVKDVDVDEGQTVGGEPAVKITGVLDPGSFEAGFMAGLPDGLNLDASFSDTRVVVFLSKASKLPLRMLIDQSLEVEGEELSLSMDLAFVGVNEPVEIPDPRG